MWFPWTWIFIFFSFFSFYFLTQRYNWASHPGNGKGRWKLCTMWHVWQAVQIGRRVCANKQTRRRAPCLVISLNKAPLLDADNSEPLVKLAKEWNVWLVNVNKTGWLLLLKLMLWPRRYLSLFNKWPMSQRRTRVGNDSVVMAAAAAGPAPPLK